MIVERQEILGVRIAVLDELPVKGRDLVGVDVCLALEARQNGPVVPLAAAGLVRDKRVALDLVDLLANPVGVALHIGDDGVVHPAVHLH